MQQTPALVPDELSRLVDRLRTAGCVFAEDEARVLLGSASDDADLRSMVERRVAGEPLEQVVGWVSFAGLRIQVAPGVFVPRRRTEVLVRHARRLLDRRPDGSPPPVVVELCCGAAGVGAALASDRRLRLFAADIDPAAVACASRNLAMTDAEVRQGDLYDALPDELRQRVDLLVVNAPYVPSASIATMPPEARLYEPRCALDGGPDGVDVHHRIAADAPAWLIAGGHLLLETSVRQAPLTTAAMRSAGLRTRVVHARDIDGTAVLGTRPAAGDATRRVA